MAAQRRRICTMRGRFIVSASTVARPTTVLPRASAIVTPAKMSVPTLLSGVEQSHAASCLGILPYDLRTLCIVAHRARVAQVVQCGLTTHRPRHNVVDFERFGTQLLLQL